MDTLVGGVTGSGVVDAATDAIHNVWETTVDAVQTAFDALSDLVSGGGLYEDENFHVDLFDSNWDSTDIEDLMGVSSDAFSGRCERCAAKMYVTFDFILDCRGYVFREMTLRVRGAAEAWLAIQAALEYDTVPKSRFDPPRLHFLFGFS